MQRQRDASARRRDVGLTCTTGRDPHADVLAVPGIDDEEERIALIDRLAQHTLERAVIGTGGADAQQFRPDHELEVAAGRRFGRKLQTLAAQGSAALRRIDGDEDGLADEVGDEERGRRR